MVDGTPDDDDLLILRRILDGTARSTGEEFFRSLVRNVSLSIASAYAFVAELATQPSRVRTLAIWGNGRFLENVEYDLAGTPCEDVVRGALCHHPRDVQRRFANDRALAEMGVESYLGVPLFDVEGQVLGHLAVLDTRPMGDEPRRISTFKIFAARAAAEMERLRAEKRLRASEQQFRDLFEEAPIAYVYEETDTRFVSANRAFCTLLGLKPEEVRGTIGRTLLAPTETTQSRIDDAFADIQLGKERGQIELELRRKDNGKPVFVQFWSRPEPDGKHTRTMLIDITDRVLAEQEKNRLEHQNKYLREELRTEHNFGEIVGGSSAMREVLGKVKQVAPATSTVLVLGETGTGKELIARAIHNHSPRKDRALIKLNCAALPPGLIESELFGHEKGAFTGAIEKRIGRFVLADGGTIFLDEIGDIPLDVQVRLLRVLQEREFEPVGSPRTVRVDVRVIAATNRDLEKAVADGFFRADLYYRLNVFPIRLPPLRDRRDDIPLLAHHLTSKYAARMGKRFERISAEMMTRLVEYSWPGNIRELENIIERAVILSAGTTLELESGVLASRPAETAPADETAPSITSAENERRHILRTLEEKRWVIEGDRGAAKFLGLHPNTLRSRMKKLGIKRER